MDEPTKTKAPRVAIKLSDIDYTPILLALLVVIVTFGEFSCPCSTFTFNLKHSILVYSGPVLVETKEASQNRSAFHRSL
jgi:hypothetical protein